MTASAFESRFVIGLGGEARPRIWQELKLHVLSKIAEYDIKCELWIDGSFITRCPEPDDIDGSLMVLSDVVEVISDEAFAFLSMFDDSTPSFHKSLDIFLCQVYPKGHPLRGDMNDPDGWAKQWSGERNSDWLKGFVVIPFR